MSLLALHGRGHCPRRVHLQLAPPPKLSHKIFFLCPRGAFAPTAPPGHAYDLLTYQFLSFVHSLFCFLLFLYRHISYIICVQLYVDTDRCGIEVIFYSYLISLHKNLLTTL